MAEGEQQINLTYDMLVLDTAKRMRDAQASGDKAAYADLFLFGINLVISYLTTGIRTKLEADLKVLRQEVARIKKDEKNEVSRKKLVDDAKAEFAELHMPYFMVTFSRVGITKPKEDGLIEFDSMGMEQWAAIVQDNRAGIMKAVEKVVGKDGLAPPAK